MNVDLQSPRARPVFAHPVSLMAGLLLMAVALALAVLAARPPSPKAAAEAVGEFSAVRALETLTRLLGDEAPHPMSSEANARVADRISDELSAMGYSVETQTTFVCRESWAVCGDVANIMSRLPGTSDGPSVLLTAHYDSIPAGPGAGMI